ncbi:MAG: 7-carboxy-7-deazaguanine synthase QueE [Hyphomicrobiaceae bacterium]|nr:MAG: 7-carboxy-7-deazaguanine synthase QueE [Hyphomicrobiaceae bacterium]
MRIAEHFYSIQGEGTSAGVPAVFLRLSGCNLLCGGHGTIEDKQLHDGATWRCDTIEVWMKGEKKTTAELLALFAEQGYTAQLKRGAHLIVTGGEPLQQEGALREFLPELVKEVGKDLFVEVETNGTISPSIELAAYVNQWNVSPKLSNSGMSEERRINTSALIRFANCLNAWCKVVVSREEDLSEVALFTQYFRADRMILMPAASDRETLRNLLPVIAELCKKECYRLSTRMQVEIWDKTTGV